MRGGTSKGLFFHSRDLPKSQRARNKVLLGAMGSPDVYRRQLDGMGGGISSLSKVVIISPPSHPNADLDYTFGQVAVDMARIDWNNNWLCYLCYSSDNRNISKFLCKHINALDHRNYFCFHRIVDIC